MKLDGPHDYGLHPSPKGALNFARDSAIARALPYYKQLLKEEHRGPGHKVAYLIRLLSPMLLLTGLVLAFLAFFIGLSSSTAYGLQSVLIDSTDRMVTDRSKYIFEASSAPLSQTWSMRAGEWGRAHSIQLGLPLAESMKKDAIVIVRNTSTETYDATNTPPTINGYVPSMQVLGPATINLGTRESTAFIAAPDSKGVQRWYPALLMSGAS